MDSYYNDEIQLEYDCFLAEQELFDNLLSLGASVNHESVGLYLIQEDYKDTVNNYIDKIVMGLQKAWDNFKNKVINAATKPVLDNVSKNIDSYDGNLQVEFWHKYNLNKFDSINMVDFNLELLESSETKIDYYNKAYGGIMVDKNISLKENIINQVIDTEDSHTITQEEMSNMYDFCNRGFKERANKLESEINRLNTNINTLKVSINATNNGETQTVTQQTQIKQENSTDTLSSLYESYSSDILTLNEAEDNNKKSTKVVNNSNGANKTQSNNIKKMNWYLSGNVDLFSAKMKILRQRYLDSIKIFRAAFPKENKKETDQIEVKQTTKKAAQKVNT